MGMQACRLPLPYFRVNASLRILDRSDEAELLFPGASEMAGITDEGSLEKLRRFVRPGSVTRLELNFLCGTDRRPQLFELHQQWEEESAAAHLLLCPLQDRLQRMQDTMEQLRRDLRQPVERRRGPPPAERGTRPDFRPLPRSAGGHPRGDPCAGDHRGPDRHHPAGHDGSRQGRVCGSAAGAGRLSQRSSGAAVSRA
ncbi:hypothetical protein [Paenibacillus mucilaginosus]|uniref:hypothetical protein n=1 Tax=Paenibacillus mucilaginosus TaxID=61624 RepID=UPI00240DAC68|nr:hypothetical protein [Paenibacillus mucilaginosus]